MKKIKVAAIAALGIVAVFAISGCNVGMAPSGGSAADVEKRFQDTDPQQQIKIIQGSPLSPDKKAEKIKAIEDKYGVKAGEAAPQPGTTPRSP